MEKIDAHQHFWKFNPVRDAWITNEMSAIQKDFMPGDLYPLLQRHGFTGTVLVQSDQSEEETDFQLENAAQYDFIKGVVGWVDLQGRDIEKRLAHYTQFNKMKGFRHVLQGEADRALMLKPAFKKGISLLKKYNFTYDILIFPDLLKYAAELVREFPDQLFVIDHIAKPDIKNKMITDWKKDIQTIAEYKNVFCKISGMVTEADLKNWKKEDFHPYMDIVVEAFGSNRIMYGSDWPVSLLAASYDQVLEIVKEYFSSFSKEEQDNFFGGNAVKFYNLN